MTKPYRENVGIVVFNAQGEVLVGERINFPGVFQFPQGGIDAGEEPLSAARRELFEEIGLKIDSAEPVGSIREWLYYDFPPYIGGNLKKYQGQKQKWFFFFWDGDINSLVLDNHEREFSRVAWWQLAAVTPQMVEFKQSVYQQVCREARQVISDYLSEKG